MLMNIPKRKILLTGSVALVVLAAGILALSYFGGYGPFNRAASTCSDEEHGSLLRKAGADLIPSDEQRMRRFGHTVSLIEGTKGYKEDINCLYAVTMHYIYNDYDHDKAKVHYQQLKQKHEEGQTISEYYDGYRLSVEEIKEEIDRTETAKQNVEDSTLYLD